MESIGTEPVPAEKKVNGALCDKEKLIQKVLDNNNSPFGTRRIDRVRLPDAKEWSIKLQQTDGKIYSAIHSIRGVLRPAFQMTVDDDILRKYCPCK